MNHRAAVSMGAGLLCLLGSMLLHAGAPAAADWDQGAAARYLDRRMDLWWTQAKTLRTSGGDSKCLSCHTAIPYVWARAALRKAQGGGQPTAHEQQIARARRPARAVRRRRSAVLRQQRGQDPRVAGRRGRDQRGRVDEPRSRSSVSEPGAETRAALARLWQVQRTDGAWDWLDFGLEPYEAPDAVFHGATLAALAAGTPTGRRASRDR